MLSLAQSGLFFVVTGVQFWLPDYLQNVHNVDAHTASIYFSITSLSAPILGVIIGGVIITHLGGYNTPKAQKTLIISGVCAVICGLPVPFMPEFYQTGILIWLLLFFGGYVVPPLTGVVINSVPDKLKTSANSIANLLQNLLGYLPAPGLYGLVASVSGGSTSRVPMGMLMFSTIFTISMLIMGITLKLENDAKQELQTASIINANAVVKEAKRAMDDEAGFRFVEDGKEALLSKEPNIHSNNQTTRLSEEIRSGSGHFKVGNVNMSDEDYAQVVNISDE